MKTIRTTFANGFTLIELLTVIAIIGILAAIIIPTTGAVRNAAKKSQTKAQFSNWVSAMTLFKQEYGYYPGIDKTTPTATGNNKLQAIAFARSLTGRELNGTALSATMAVAQLYGNTKRLSFYALSEDDLNNPTTPTLIVDAFGNTDIAVFIDRDGNGLIETADGASTSVGVAPSGSTTALRPNPTLTFPIRAPIVFFSAGKGNTRDDIVFSWK